MKLFRILFAAVLFIAISTIAYSQETASTTDQYDRLPKEKVIIGFDVMPTGYSYGLNFGYALSPLIHVGANVGVTYQSTYFETAGSNEDKYEELTLVFSPYAKYFFDNVKHFRPFAMVQFDVLTTPEVSQTTYGAAKKAVTKNQVGINVGAEWFPYTSVSVHGGFRFFNFVIDPVGWEVGLGSTFVGIAWYI